MSDQCPDCGGEGTRLARPTDTILFDPAGNAVTPNATLMREWRAAHKACTEWGYWLYLVIPLFLRHPYRMLRYPHVTRCSGWHRVTCGRCSTPIAVDA
jgi:hypothetical protein